MRHCSGATALPLSLAAVRLASAGCGNQSCHFSITARLSERERCAATGIGEIRVGAGLQQGFHALPMTDATVTENDGFDKSRPTEIVDMIQRRPGADQFLHHGAMSQMRRGN